VTGAFLQEFKARGEIATFDSSEWLEPLRRTAMERFTLAGFPSARDEEWRFTPVTPLTQKTWNPVTASPRVTRAQLQPFIFGHAEWTTLVFVNGIYAPSLSSLGVLEKGVRVGNLAAALTTDRSVLQAHLARYATIETSPFTALSTAFLREGGFVHVPPDTTVTQPVHLVFVSTAESGSVMHPRNLVIVDRGSKASVIESYVTLSDGSAYWTNAVTEVVTGANSWLEHTRIQRESEQAFHIGATHVNQHRDSHYRSFSMAMGAALARHNLHVRLDAENVETLLYGLYLARGDQLVDNHTVIFHDHPNCRSWEVYKGILDGRARGVFNGKVFVRPEAQKTDAKQTNRNLLLSDTAKVNTKPQLEIFADDVKCTHGATVGRLDEHALFYARSRGLAAADAQRLLTYAFAAEVIEEVTLEPVRSELERLLRDRLGSL
jgi:Fe-S cluster assembly protein SufD